MSDRLLTVAVSIAVLDGSVAGIALAVTSGPAGGRTGAPRISASSSTRSTTSTPSTSVPAASSTPTATAPVPTTTFPVTGTVPVPNPPLMTPVADPDMSLTGAVSVVGGFLADCAVLADGGVVCWGSNSNGALGDGSTASESVVAVSVTGITDATSVTTSDDIFGGACAVLETGAVDCWGTTAGEISATAPAAVSRMCPWR